MRRLITSSDDKERQLVDGIRIYEDKGWVLVAPDRMKASFYIFAESRSDETTTGLLNRYRGLVEEWQRN
jgi:phosphomannomutase